MAPHLLFQPLNDLNGLNHSPSHTSHENQLLLSSEAESGDNFQPLTGHHAHEGQLEQGQLMTPQIPFQPLPGHHPHEGQLEQGQLITRQIPFQALTGQHPQHGYEGQLEQEQLLTPRIPFQPRSIHNTHQVQRWLEEEDVFQEFRDGHDHESQARFEDSETQFGREEARLFRPFAQSEDYRDEQLVKSQGLRGSQVMLTQPEEQMEQGGLGQERDGTIPSLATDFVPQPFQDLQNHHSPYDAHNPNAASSQAYFQQQPDQQGRQWTYQDTQHGNQDRHQHEVQPYTVLPWDLLPQQTAYGQPNHQEQQSMHMSQPQEAAYAQQPIWPSTSPDIQSWAGALMPSNPSGRDSDSPSFWQSLPQQAAHGQLYHQRQQSIHTSQPQEEAYAQQPIWPSTSPDTQSWAATLVPSSSSGRDLNSPSLRENSPEQVANGRQDHQGQKSMYSCQPEQKTYGQQPIRDSTPPRILSRAATPIPSNPPGVDSDSMTHRQLRVWNNSFSIPSHLGRDDLIKQAKTGKPIQRVKKSKRSQKKPIPKGLTAEYGVDASPKTGLSAAKKHCPTCTCTQAVSVAPAYDPPSEPNMPPVRSSRKRRMHESSPQQPSVRRSTRENAYKGPF